MRRVASLLLCVGLGLFTAGCPKGQSDYSLGKKAESLGDLDQAYEYYLKASKAEPSNPTYKIKMNQTRFEAGERHIKEGVALRNRGDLQGAVSQFQRAQVIDPSSMIAEQEFQRTLEAIAEKTGEAQAAIEQQISASVPALVSAPPEIKPLSRAPINLKMSNDAKIVYDTIGKLAGLTVIYDPDFQARRITTELNDVTLEQALDIVSLESKSFWKPVTENIIFVIPDQPQKRRDYEEQVVRTFYMSNVAQPQELTEIVTGLRQLLDLKRVMQVNTLNAIVIRDTPDKLALAQKMIDDIDKARPEVLIQVEVLQARRDIVRDLGIRPGSTVVVAFTPPGSTSTSGTSTSTTTTTNSLPLNKTVFWTGNYSITMPGATATALLTDSTTKIIENPEIRSVDGQEAKLKIGDRVPIATGSFQAGVGVGATGGAGFVNPLVNTQFQYIDTGVNIDITPHVHPNHEISLKVLVDVSAVTGHQNIGGIDQPIISQRKIEHDIRLRDGEISILGGLIDHVESKGVEGWPGFAHIPIVHYFFSNEHIEKRDTEVLIVLIPRIVRLPAWSKANLRPLYSGSETNIQVKRESDVRAPTANPPAPPQPNGPGNGAPITPAPSPVTPGANPGPGGQGPRVHFEPQTLTLKAGQTATLGVVVDNVTDLYSIPMLLQYNPAVISVEEIQHGGFLSGGTQEIAMVQRVDKEHGQAIISATRQPNTPGVNGSGTLLGVVVKALAPGTTNLSIVQINAKDSQQKPIPLVTSEATLQVQP